MSDLAQRREALRTQITELERQQGCAVLDGKPFDAKPLVAAHEELKALDAADTELVRREREADAVARAEAYEADRLLLVEQCAGYVKAVAVAQRATEGMVAAYADVHALGADMAATAKRMGRRVAAAEPMETRITLSRLLTNALKGLGATGRYGEIPLRSVEFWANDWVKHPAAVERAVADITQGVEA